MPGVPWALIRDGVNGGLPSPRDATASVALWAIFEAHCFCPHLPG